MQAADQTNDFRHLTGSLERRHLAHFGVGDNNRPLMPVKPFESIDQARLWTIGLVDWYNQEHRHSAIRFVTPQERHLGQDVQLLQERSEVYAQARAQNPQHWSKNTRDWSRVTEVHLNPDKTVSKEIKSPEH